MDDPTLVEWAEWGPDAFERARAEKRPVVLFLTAPWCVWCARMEEEAFANPSVAANVNDDFVPIRVDADRRPRVRERYQMGGFPSTVFLTPAGEVLSGTTYLSTEALRSVLERVRETWEERGADAGRIPRALQDPDPPRGDLDGVEAHMASQVEAAFDEEYGGWGTDAKFPLPRTVEFALKRDRDRALRTLEAIRTHLLDTYDGGFYRYATARDWGDPHREKLLDENAALVRAFADAYLYTGETAYRDPAADTVDYLTTTLWTPAADERGRENESENAADHADGDGGDRTSGAFAGSQAGGDYYTLEPTEREAADPPRVDETVFAGRNGLAVDALLRYHAYTDDERARRYAERALGTVRETLVEDGAVAHFDGPEAETGVLVDQARVLGALTAAGQVLGGRERVDAARTVADWTVDRCRADDGTFLDGVGGDLALLDRPLRPLDATVELADALVDLAALTGEDDYRAVARQALSAFAGARDRMGVEVAGYAAAAARAVDAPLIVEVGTAPGSDLHRAALRVADHEKVVVPDADGLDGAARVRIGDRVSEPADAPATLQRRVEEFT